MLVAPRASVILACATYLRGWPRPRPKRAAPLVLPLHPRTKKRLQEQGLQELANRCILLDPMGYVDLLSLVRAATLVTDSGGLQKEAYYAQAVRGGDARHWMARTDRHGLEPACRARGSQPRGPLPSRFSSRFPCRITSTAAVRRRRPS